MVGTVAVGNHWLEALMCHTANLYNKILLHYGIGLSSVSQTITNQCCTSCSAGYEESILSFPKGLVSLLLYITKVILVSVRFSLSSHDCISMFREEF